MAGPLSLDRIRGYVCAVSDPSSRILWLWKRSTGDTDSETVFRWMLNRMDAYGLDPEAPAESVEPVVALIEDSVSELIDLAIAVEAPTTPTLNFIIGDGRNLVASRFGNSLF